MNLYLGELPDNFRKDHDIILSIISVIDTDKEVSHSGQYLNYEVFEDIHDDDWVMCSWRSHYQCLLKGVPEERLFSEIMVGHSISLCFPEYRIFSSALVGGALPIATGVALSIQRKRSRTRVHCFLGDMTAETGIAHECIKYSSNQNLPIRFIVEDNGKSVCTDTFESWGMKSSSFSQGQHSNVVYYEYESSYPHAGAGVRVQF